MANYYDLDEMLMEEEVPPQIRVRVSHLLLPSLSLFLFSSMLSSSLLQPLPVVFRVAAHGVGVLDPGSEDNNVEQGAKVDIPLWLAQDLYHRQAVKINLPSYFGQRLRKEMQADPACVDLRSRCPYFYEVGCKLVPLTPDATLGSFLLYALRGRYKDILCKAHSAAVTTTPKFMKLLTREEINLFESGRDSMKAFKKWRLEGTRLERAAVLGKKRKPSPSIASQ